VVLSVRCNPRTIYILSIGSFKTRFPFHKKKENDVVCFETRGKALAHSSYDVYDCAYSVYDKSMWTNVVVLHQVDRSTGSDRTRTDSTSQQWDYVVPGAPCKMCSPRLPFLAPVGKLLHSHWWKRWSWKPGPKQSHLWGTRSVVNLSMFSFHACAKTTLISVCAEHLEWPVSCG
jgi:hypothetical protein